MLRSYDRSLGHPTIGAHQKGVEQNAGHNGQHRDLGTMDDGVHSLTSRVRTVIEILKHRGMLQAPANQEAIPSDSSPSALVEFVAECALLLPTEVRMDVLTVVRRTGRHGHGRFRRWRSDIVRHRLPGQG